MESKLTGAMQDGTSYSLQTTAYMGYYLDTLARLKLEISFTREYILNGICPFAG